MEKLKFLSRYFTPVGSTIDINRPLRTIDFETKLIDYTVYSKPINTGGIEIGEPTKVGTHIKTYNEIYHE